MSVVSPRRLGVVVALSMLVVSCGDQSVVDVRMVLPSALEAPTVFSSIDVRFDDAMSGARVSSSTVDAASLAAGTTDLGAAVEVLEPGRSYVASVIARTDGSTCGRGRAVGLSLPFTDLEESYIVPLQAGCADEFARTRRAPANMRVGGMMALGGDGKVVIVGGAEQVTLDGTMGPYQSLLTSIERYDPRSGRFELAGSLVEGHAAGAAVSLPSGGVAVIGGYDGTALYCASMIEVVGSGTGATLVGTLLHRRCGPAAVRLRSVARVAVIGGAIAAVTDRGADAEIYESTMRVRTAGAVRGATFRIFPAVTELGDGRSALVVGGAIGAEGTPTTPHSEVLRVGPECGGGPDAACFVDVPADASVPIGVWTGMTASYVPCASGGGAVYIVGGNETRSGIELVRDEVHCYRDEPGRIGTIVAAGHLADRRQNHAAAVVRAPDGGSRLLIVGGTRGSGETPHQDALLVPVDGCACTVVDPEPTESLLFPFDGFTGPPMLARMGDGSVLALGAFEFAGTDLLTATRDAALFIPDLP